MKLKFLFEATNLGNTVCVLGMAGMLHRFIVTIFVRIYVVLIITGQAQFVTVAIVNLTELRKYLIYRSRIDDTTQRQTRVD